MPDPGPVSSGPLLAVDGLVAGYGRATVLHHVSFAAEAGQRVAVLGPNGGGKTTLFRVITGELTPRGGTVQAPASCGVVPQTERSRLDFPVSALDVATMGAISRLPWWRRPGRRERDAARRALDAVGLVDAADSTFGDLSGGQRQRVLVARALVQDARVLLLDEPFNGLDTTSAARLHELVDRLAGEGRVLLIATHDIDHARRWDRVLCLNERQVAFGEPDRVLTRSVLEETYGQAVVTLPGQEQVVVPAHHHHH